MAISDNVPGVKVTVAVDGTDLTEYRDEDLEEEEGTTTRFIEAKTGQTFEVRITVDRGFHFAGDTLACYVSLDGQWVHTPLIGQDSCRFQSHCRTSSGALTGDGMLRKYQFAELEGKSSICLYEAFSHADPGPLVNDGCMTTEDAKQFKELGTIKVRVAHRRKTAMIGRNGEAQFADTLSVPEKALKGQAMSHRAQYCFLRSYTSIWPIADTSTGFKRQCPWSSQPFGTWSLSEASRLMWPVSSSDTARSVMVRTAPRHRCSY